MKGGRRLEAGGEDGGTHGPPALVYPSDTVLVRLRTLGSVAVVGLGEDRTGVTEAGSSLHLWSWTTLELLSISPHSRQTAQRWLWWLPRPRGRWGRPRSSSRWGSRCRCRSPSPASQIATVTSSTFTVSAFNQNH